MQLSMIGKYCRLIYLPIFAIGFITPRVRNLSLNSFLVAICITCILSILKDADLIAGVEDPGEVFYNHIITGFMVAVAAYISGLFAFQHKGRLRVIYLMMLVLTTYQVLFINTGRTGYVVYFLLIALLFLQKLSLKHAAIGVLMFSGAIVLAYTQSITMQIRVHALVQDVQFFKENNPNTSLGFRIQFHNYAKSLFIEHPITGIGTAGFKYSFAQSNAIPVWGKELTDPHSQYWMTLSEQGIIGLVLLLTFLGSLFITSFKLKETKPILLGILLAFCVGSFSDTILCYSTAGYLLIVLSALCFGELIEKRALVQVKDRSPNSLDRDSIGTVQLGKGRP